MSVLPIFKRVFQALHVLAKELKELEQHKLIRREVIDCYPVKITYKSEPYVGMFTPIIYALKDWGMTHRMKIFEQELKQN
jgi:DNA-binding HxlR family transcriptional regulator